MIDDKTVVMQNAVIFDEAEIIKSSIGSEVLIDKYTRVEYSTIAEHVRLERNNQIEQLEKIKEEQLLMQIK